MEPRFQGVSTVKLVALTLLVISLSILGGIAYESHERHENENTVELGFDLPPANPSG